MAANSQFIASKIREVYGREATVIHPFADLERFGRARNPGRNYFVLSAFAPYKRIDVAIAAFNRLNLPLLVAGGGQDEMRLKAMAGPTVEFVGALSQSVVEEMYSKARAFVFPGTEDFGITPIEAMASGVPVVAFAHGGALETVTSETGVLYGRELPESGGDFDKAVDALCEAIQSLESVLSATDGAAVTRFETACRARATHFSRAKFKSELANWIRAEWQRAGKSDAALAAAMS